MRARWNIRVRNLPDKSRVPMRCQFCRHTGLVDLSAELDVMLVVKVEDRVVCENCGSRYGIDLAVPRDQILWDDGD